MGKFSPTARELRERDRQALEDYNDLVDADFERSLSSAEDYLNVNFPNTNIVSNWNVKRASSSVDLSQLRPYISLISVYDEGSTTASGGALGLADYRKLEWSNGKVRRFLIGLQHYELNGDRSGAFSSNGEAVMVRGRPIAENKSQMQTRNLRGGIDVSSINVERGTHEEFNVRFVVKISIADPNILNEDIAFNSLITLNQKFLITYGWDIGREFEFSTHRAPPNVWNSKPGREGAAANGARYNVTSAKDNAYNTSYLASLYKFDYGFSEDGKLEGTLEFMAPQMAILTMVRNADISGTMAKYLDEPSLVDNVPGEGSGHGIPVISKRKSGDDQHVFYSLSWVLTALNKALKASGQKTINIDTKDIRDDVRAKLDVVLQTFRQEDAFDGVDDRVATFSRGIYNVGGVPIAGDKLREFFTPDGTTNIPLIETLKQVISNPAVPGIEIGVRNSNGVIQVFLLSVDLNSIKTSSVTSVEDGDQGEDEMFTIAYGEPGGLVESIDLVSKLDPNAFDLYSIPVHFGGNNFDLYGSLKENRLIDDSQLIGMLKDDSDISDSIRDDIADYLKANKSIGEIQLKLLQGNKDEKKVAQRFKTAVDKFFSRDMRKYAQLAALVIDGPQGNLFGSILGFYLKRTNVTIHGTAGLAAYQYLRIKNLIKGMSGVYNIIKVTDQVDSNGFTTAIEASLIKPDVDTRTGSTRQEDGPNSQSVDSGRSDTSGVANTNSFVSVDINTLSSQDLETLEQSRIISSEAKEQTSNNTNSNSRFSKGK